ncbi:MAG: GNAT family N-acetyltransferase [Kiritimatiellae bacterium]|nr:GNAT family N-acetyltransferase [Kiritimatiellia bacterium]
MIVRTMLEADVPAVATITSDCYRALARREQYTTDELSALLAECASEEAVRRRYRGFAAFVAEQDDAVVGVVAIERNEVAQLFVSPVFQGRGTGRRLLAAAEAAIMNSGCRTSRVWSASAPGFYEKVGYGVTEKRVCAGGPLKGRPLVVLDKILTRD